MRLGMGATLLMAGALVVAACTKDGKEAEPPTRRVRCAPSVSGRAVDRLELRGAVMPRPERDALVASQVAGVVAGVDVREGEAVSRGQVIARIDRAVLTDATLQAEAALQKAQAERRNADATLDRAKGVYEQGISARQDLDDAVARAAAAQAAEVTAASSLAQAQRQLGRSLVRAPLDGVVLRVLRREGELVDGTPAMPLVEVADLAALELSAEVPAAELARLKVGQLATLAVPGTDVEAPGAVWRLAPTVDRMSGLGVVRVAVTDGGLPVAVGTPAVARVEVAARDGVTLVPATALRNRYGPLAEVVRCEEDGDGGVARVASVRPRARAGALLEVEGLDAGAAVAVEGVLGVKDGDRLEVEQ